MKPEAIIIHCSATPNNKTFTIDDIDHWHRERGFTEIGYHFVIYPDGSIHPGRSLQKDGAHCVGWNHKAIGICYIGGLNPAGYPADTRTSKQKTAIRELVDVLRNTYPGITEILGHRDINPGKACPCFDVKSEFYILVPSKINGN